MASKTEIFNLALVGGLGGEPLASSEDNVKAARVMRALWDQARDQALRDHAWNFAMKRATLPRLDETPAFGYSYAYQLPADCLRVWGLVGDGADVDPDLTYKIEGGKLLYSGEEAQLKYTARITDTSLYDSSFVMAVALKLALLSGRAITGEKPDGKQIEMNLVDMGGARSIDAQEDTPEVVDSDTWGDARL